MSLSVSAFFLRGARFGFAGASALASEVLSELASVAGSAFLRLPLLAAGLASASVSPAPEPRPCAALARPVLTAALQLLVS